VILCLERGDQRSFIRPAFWFDRLGPTRSPRWWGCLSCCCLIQASTSPSHPAQLAHAVIRADVHFPAYANYSSQMPQYVFRIRQGTHSSNVPVDLADHDAAWHGGAKVCSDLTRDVVARLRDSPEWRFGSKRRNRRTSSSLPVDCTDFQEGKGRLSWRPLLFARPAISSVPMAEPFPERRSRHYNNNRPAKFSEATSLRSVNYFLEI
jgi:hypothetical protein